MKTILCVLLSFTGYKVIALVVLIAMLALYCFYLKMKNKKQLENEQAVIEQKNVLLENISKENEWLRREIHHRVKNNLQIVMSLLSSQSEFLTDAVAIEALKNSRQRVNAMSLLQKRLYINHDVCRVNIYDYVIEMIEHVKENFNVSSAVCFDVDAEDLTLEVDAAVPLGLILNEVLTNSLSHAFPSGAGIIRIAMYADENENFVLQVSDNGKGVGDGFNLENDTTLGLRLIRGLSKELDASLDFKSNVEGTTVKAVFALKHTAVEQ